MTALAWLAAAVVLPLGGPAAAPQDAEFSADLRAAARQIADGDQAGGLQRLQVMADGGDLQAHNLLGELYAGLGGVPRDRPRSCEHFRAARESSASAAHNYGQCLWEGAFGQRDLEQARVWYGRGADRGFDQAKCALGNMLIRGEGGPAEPVQGVALCREAAEAGDPNAQADMGDHYGAGMGVPQDFAEARRWYRLAAAQQQRNAAYQLGTLDWNGLGGPIDLVSAGAWFEKAYAVGRRDAAFVVGQGYLIRAVPNAPSGPVDAALLAKAKTWFEIAMREDPEERRRAQAATNLARISGFEDLSQRQAGAGN